MSDNSNIKNFLLNVKSNYILKQIFANLTQKIILEVIRYNKNLKTKLNKDINDYKKYLQIELEIIPSK
jgi:hypothetical protein